MPTAESRLDALFYPYTICLDPTTLKYLLLLYDRILYLPIDNRLNPGHATLSKRWSMYDGLLYSAFGTREQAHRAGMYSSDPSGWDREMSTLMADYDRLEADGVCVGLRDERFESPTNSHPLNAAVDEDLRDERFVYAASRVQNPKLLIPGAPGHNIKGGGVMLRPPRHSGRLAFAEITSQRLNGALLFAEAEDVVPVGTHPAFTVLLNTKLRRIIERQDATERTQRFSRASRARFSMLSWEVLTEVASRDAVRRRSVDDILKYRTEAREASSRFRAYLRELESQFTEQPWSEGFRDELSATIQRAVLPEVLRVREAKAQIWEKLFDESLTTILSAKNVMAAAGALTLKLGYVPSVTYVELLGAAGGVLAAELLPTLVGARRADIQRRRNSLFFILQLA